ncbi:cAMP-regulated phosphoprotein 21, partial [Podila horticola]
MSNEPETQTSQSNEEETSPSRGNPSFSSSSSTATAVQSHKQQQSKHKSRHEVKSKSSLPPIQECTLAECIALLRLENSPTGSCPSSSSVVSGEASAGASATQEEPASNECSSTPGTGTGTDASSASPLDCFLTEALKNHQHRLFILKLERDFSQFLDQTSLESMELPWINSFYRMMIHKVAIYFQLERRIDTTQKTITLYRTDQSAVPTFRFMDLMQQEEVEEEEAPVPAPAPAPAAKPIKVLKRCPPRPATVCGGRSSSSSRADESRRSTVSIKEREEAYAKARARIFQGTEETGYSQSPSSSLSSSDPPKSQSTRSNTEELAAESNADETSTVVGSDTTDFIASSMSPGPSTPCRGHDGPVLHQRGRSSESSDLGYPSPQQCQYGQFYGDPSRRTSAPSLGAIAHRQVVPGARHFVQGSDGVIRYDPTIDTSQQPTRQHTSG